MLDILLVSGILYSIILSPIGFITDWSMYVMVTYFSFSLPMSIVHNMHSLHVRSVTLTKCLLLPNHWFFNGYLL